MNKFFLTSFIFISIVGGIVLPKEVDAARLYFRPDQGSYRVGETFGVEVRVDTDEEGCVNVFGLDIRYAPQFLRVADVSRGESILTLWPEPPTSDEVGGLLSFVGGIPGGYCGRTAGDPGLSNIIAKVFFTVLPDINEGVLPRSVRVVFQPSSRVLLNDGLGNVAELKMDPAEFTILPSDGSLDARNELYDELQSDSVPPEPFVVQIYQDPSLFRGKYFLIFSTTDKQSGIDHYEVLETNALGFKIYNWQRAVWKAAESPYVLDDQRLRSIIKVKAVDNAGNERIIEYVPPEYLASRETALYPVAIIGIGVLLIGGFIMIRKFIARRSLKKKNDV